MGQIARLRAGALHDLGIAGQHGVEAIYQRLHLGRERALQLCPCQPTQAATASTAAFVVLVAASAALILPSRRNHTGGRSLWTGLTPVSLWVLGGTLAALSAITNVPWLAAAFKFVPMSPAQWLAALGAGLALVLVFQGNKRWMGVTARSGSNLPGLR